MELPAILASWLFLMPLMGMGSWHLSQRSSHYFKHELVFKLR